MLTVKGWLLEVKSRGWYAPLSAHVRTVRGVRRGVKHGLCGGRSMACMLNVGWVLYSAGAVHRADASDGVVQHGWLLTVNSHGMCVEGEESRVMFEQRTVRTELAFTAARTWS